MNKNFLTEFIARLGSSNPQFFRIIQIIAIVLGALSAALHYVDTSQTVLPSWLAWLESTTTWVTSFVAAILAQLPNENINTPKP